VQVGLDARHVPDEERPVGADGVPGEGGFAGLFDVRRDEVEDLLLGVGQRDAVGELVEQTGGGVHVADEVAHLLERGRGRRDHQVDPVTEHVQFVVGDQDRDLDQGIVRQVEAGHLAVDPHQPVVHGHPPYGEPPTLRRQPAVQRGA
jgi:hypothetical protein